ncbi:MAG: Lipopolysaccharide export system ATP-binding protein LptB [Lentisphaerae bacterium ADurb.BinA184]|nr:MAG: Lipopolysaccharide export system ATP-binding protein LptB [Lentisphaerae bacterium ADurb.BinA184]
MALLDVENVHRSFGGLQAVRGVSLTVTAGQIKAVIGPNGAGKTTLFNTIAGMLRPDAGDIRFDGRSIIGLPPCRIARLGISRTYQNLSLFRNMTVLENVMVGRHVRTRCGILSAALRLPRQRAEEARVRDDARRCLDQVGLLARALATEPRLLLLDEPASGLNTRETAELGQLIRRIRDGGVTILLIEHDMSLIMDIADDILVLCHGQPVAEGPPATVRHHPEVIAIYLGGDVPSAGH